MTRARRLMLAALVSFLAATATATGCSSTPAPLALCKDPPGPISSCEACLPAHCESEVTSLEAACAGYFACTETCDCTMGDCATNCSYMSIGCIDMLAAPASSVCPACKDECPYSIGHGLFYKSPVIPDAGASDGRS